VDVVGVGRLERRDRGYRAKRLVLCRGSRGSA
jgi:hypothetical protein